MAEKDHGTPELQQHHTVVVNRGIARVVNQRPIDAYCWAGKLTGEQWQAGNRLADLYVWAGLSPWKQASAYREYVTPPHHSDVPPSQDATFDALHAYREALQTIAHTKTRKLLFLVCCVDTSMRSAERQVQMRKGWGMPLFKDGLDILAEHFGFTKINLDLRGR